MYYANANTDIPRPTVILTVAICVCLERILDCPSCTVEPLNKGHIGTRSFVLYREVSFIRRLKCTGIIEIGMSRFVLYREVSFIRRLKCTVIIGLGRVDLSIVERLFRVSFIGGSTVFVL